MDGDSYQEQYVAIFISDHGWKNITLDAEYVSVTPVCIQDVYRVYLMDTHLQTIHNYLCGVNLSVSYVS